MGFFKKLERGIRRPVKKIAKKVIRPLLPYALATLGYMTAGPMGATIGGSIGGAAQGNKRNLLKNAAMGGIKGYGTGLGISALTGNAGGQGLSSLLGSKAPMFGNVAGRAGAMQGLSGLGGTPTHGLGGMGSFMSSHGLGGAAQYLGQTAKGLGGLGGLLGGKGGLDSLLMATALGGKIFGKEKNKGPTEEQRMREEEAKFQQGTGYRRPKPLHRKEAFRPPPHSYADIESGMGFTPSPFFEEANPETEYYATGGYVRGGSSGQADDVRTEIPKGAYVMNATDVSLLGDGNSDHGAEMLRHLEDKAARAGFYRQYPQSANVKVMLSHGEYPLHPGTVEYLGGPKRVDKMRHNLRKHKGVSKILPPKTKPLESYLR